MHQFIWRLPRSARGTIIGLLLLAPVGLAAQERAAVPSLSGSASAGFAMGSLGYRLGTLEIAREIESGGLLSARFLVGSRPQMQCASEDLHPSCDERSGFAALLGGVQFVPFSYGVEPYMGVQVGMYYYEGVVSASNGFMAAPQVGLRLPLGSFGGAYADASYLLVWRGGIPMAGMGLYLRPRSLREW